MVIDLDANYSKFIALLEKQGARFPYWTEWSTCLLDHFESDRMDECVGLNMASVALLSDVKDIRAELANIFKVQITDDIFNLFLDLKLVEHGNCSCGAWLECNGAENDDGRIYRLYRCPFCGEEVREYDNRATREAWAWRDTMKTLNANR